MPGGRDLVACFFGCGRVIVDSLLDAGYDRVTDVVGRVPEQRAMVVEEITGEVRAGHGYHGFAPSGNQSVVAFSTSRAPFTAAVARSAPPARLRLAARLPSRRPPRRRARSGRRKAP